MFLKKESHFEVSKWQNPPRSPFPRKGGGVALGRKMILPRLFGQLVKGDRVVVRIA